MRYRAAPGSARKTLSCREVSAVFGYVPKDAQLSDQLIRVVGTLVSLVRAKSSGFSPVARLRAAAGVSVVARQGVSRAQMTW